MGTRSGLVAVLCLGLATTASGCTVGGLVIGALSPRYAEVPRDQVQRLPQGDDVSITVRRPPPNHAKGELVEAKTPRCPGGLVVKQGSRLGCVELEEVETVEHRVGSYAGLGAVIGSLIDLALIAWIASSIHSEPSDELDY